MSSHIVPMRERLSPGSLILTIDRNQSWLHFGLPNKESFSNTIWADGMRGKIVCLTIYCYVFKVSKALKIWVRRSQEGIRLLNFYTIMPFIVLIRERDWLSPGPLILTIDRSQMWSHFCCPKGRVLGIMNSCHKVVWLIGNTTLKLCADCAKQFVRNAQNCGKTNYGWW